MGYMICNILLHDIHIMEKCLRIVLLAFGHDTVPN
jgi:hypothetical protein